MAKDIFSKLDIKEKVLMSPMAGVTDRAFREICQQCGATYFTSEMVSTKGLMYNNDKTMHLIKHTDLERPFCVQLFGSDIDSFKESAKLLSTYEDIDVIDINMGCPAPKIVNNGAGSALMKNPELCGKIVAVTRENTDFPVTVKIRSGWDFNNINAVEVAKYCQESGAQAIFVHGRTKKQMFSGTCDLDVIKNVKEAVDIPVVGNGDVDSIESAKRMLKYTGCDKVSIARGILGNPWIIGNINMFFDNGIVLENPDMKTKIDIVKEHVLKLVEYKGERVGIREARKHICWYLKSIKDASKYRKSMFSIDNLDGMLKFFRILEKQLEYDYKV